MGRHPLLIAAVVCAVATPAGAQEARSDNVYSGVLGEMSIATPEQAGDFEISIDGRVDEGVWETAAVLTGFTQFDPSEGIPATQDTEVRVFVTHDAIYFGVKAYDDNVDGIRATMAQRDQVTRNDDYVRIILDTFNDQRRAYVFSVNPYGVQQDGIWLEGGGSGRRSFGPPIDDNPDYLWDSAGRVHDWGYAVEMKIPFKSLRFPKIPLQEWGIQVNRRIQRNGFQQSWGPSFARQPNKLSEAGRLQGLADLDPGLFMQVNPVFTGSRSGALDGDDFVRDDPEGEFGLNLTYGLTSNLTLDGTVNPDFSQVEADAGQIAVNERFALFFPEQRPFFLEGTEIFGLPQNLVFTRTIANPIVGTKLTGKMGGASVGYLGAIDQYADEDDVFANMLRLRQDIGGTSTAGLVYTDRTRNGDEFNRVAGVDGRFVFARQYTLSVQGAASLDQNGPDSDRVWGGLGFMQFRRSGRKFQAQVSARDISNDFRAESGFLRRTGEVQLELRDTQYRWFGQPGALIENLSFGAELNGIWDHDDFWAGRGLKEGQTQLQWLTSFRNNITVWLSGSRSYFDFQPADYDGLFVDDGQGGLEAFRPSQDDFHALYSLRMFSFFSGWETLRGRISGNIGESPIFDSRTGTATEVADSWGADVNLTIIPTSALRLELGVRHQSLSRQSDGSKYSEATIPRLRAQYQFNRSLFVRGIFEYSAQDRGDLVDPATGRVLQYCSGDSCSNRSGSETNDFSVEGLLSYEPSPGTVFFFGYSRQMRDFEAFRFRDVQTRRDGLFMKVSYLFRM